MGKGYVPVRCVHGNSLTEILVNPQGKPPGVGLLQLPNKVEPVDHPAASVSSMGETTTAKLEGFLHKVRERSQEVMRHLLAYDEVAKHYPPPAHFPELQRAYLQDRMSLVEDRTEDLLAIIKTQLEARRRVEEELSHLPFPPMSPEYQPGVGVWHLNLSSSILELGQVRGGRPVDTKRQSSTRNMVDEGPPGGDGDVVVRVAGSQGVGPRHPPTMWAGTAA